MEDVKVAFADMVFQRPASKILQSGENQISDLVEHATEY